MSDLAGQALGIARDTCFVTVGFTVIALDRLRGDRGDLLRRLGVPERVRPVDRAPTAAESTDTPNR